MGSSGVVDRDLSEFCLRALARYKVDLQNAEYLLIIE